MKFHANTKSKKLLLVLGAIFTVAVIIATTVFTTVAYLTSHSFVVNTFTIGKVGIQLTEAKVNEDGFPIDNNGNVIANPTMENTIRVSQNNYHLVPNRTYMKDPTITVEAGSEETFLFIIISNGIELIECNDSGVSGHEHNGTIATQLAANGWTKYKTYSNGTVYVYTGRSAAATAVTEGNYKLFETFTISSQSSATIANYATANITINAMAIQAATLDQDSAWNTLVQSYGYIVGTEVTPTT